jgi:hypothetical protein
MAGIFPVAMPSSVYVLTPFGKRVDWKQSRQYTGFPGVGRNGTCVGVPHVEQTASWNSREVETGVGADIILLPVPP